MSEYVAYAGAIAAKLQGAHERRRNGREDMKMEKNAPKWEGLASIWDDDPFVHAMKLVERLDKVLNDLAASGHAPGDPQASAVSAERVVELEQRVANMVDRAEQAERELAAVERARDALADIVATAYVQREVGWADVAAGMMTIARDGTPWMVKAWVADGSTVVLQQGSQAFEKTPAPGETVRVLVPYVTPEAAEGLAREQLGGTAVS